LKEVEKLKDKQDEDFCHQDVFAIYGLCFSCCDLSYLTQYPSLLDKHFRFVQGSSGKILQNRHKKKCKAMEHVSGLSDIYRLLEFLDGSPVSCWLRRYQHRSALAETALVVIAAFLECVPKKEFSQCAQKC
jgi:hypothetical protein